MPQGMVERLLAPVARLARIRLDQYHRMLETGILQDGDPIELLDGLLVYKDRSARGEDPMSIGRRHNAAIKLLARLDAAVTPFGCHMQTQGPVTIEPATEPEPDGAVVRGEPRNYLGRLPAAADALAVIEVADSSLSYDRTTKLEIYACAGIPQYLIVNLPEQHVEVFEQPDPREGRYARAAVFVAGQAMPLLVEGSRRVEVQVSDLLP
ncbi:MAG: Uma2 family endonuclease [Planctomycetes bacterium]|nr:Uma2 family endonuclease [Planctomycetota bacterium]